MRVLMVKLGAIGDVIMSLTAISALRARNPEAHLTWIVGKASRQILGLVEGVDEVVTVDEARLFAGGAWSRLSEIGTLWRHLFGRSFDLVITGHSDPRYRVLTLPVFARARRSFGAKDRGGPLPGRLHSHEYSRLLSGEDGPGASVYQLPRISRPLPLPPLQKNRRDSTVVVLAPGGARNALRESPLRRWPAESYAALARVLIARGHTVVLVGSEQDRDVTPHFEGLPIVDLLGRTSLTELASVFKVVDGVVTHDSLAVHMARLARAPVVALFGPTSPLSFGPQNPGEPGDIDRTRVIWGGARLPCRPCYDGKEFHRCPANRCMTEITVTEVVSRLEEILPRRPVA